MNCPQCSQPMRPAAKHLSGVFSGWACDPCLIFMAKTSRIDTAQMGEVDITELGDCCCGHSWYDHIGWRVGTSHEARTDCRIANCSCPESCGGYRPKLSPPDYYGSQE